jgi:hypothetical protein
VDDAVGKEELVADLPAYVTGSRSASAAVLFISDLFGKNLVAGFNAAAGFAAACAIV